MCLTFTTAVNPLGLPGHRKTPPTARVLGKVVIPDGSSCWEWQGYVAPNGYGMGGLHGKVQYAHRIAYEAFIGPVPDGLHLDHLCRNRRCVKPAHLEPVTQAENNRRAWAARK